MTAAWVMGRKGAIDSQPEILTWKASISVLTGLGGWPTELTAKKPRLYSVLFQSALHINSVNNQHQQQKVTFRSFAVRRTCLVSCIIGTQTYTQVMYGYC